MAYETMDAPNIYRHRGKLLWNSLDYYQACHSGWLHGSGSRHEPVLRRILPVPPYFCRDPQETPEIRRGVDARARRPVHGIYGDGVWTSCQLYARLSSCRLAFPVHLDRHVIRLRGQPAIAETSRSHFLGLSLRRNDFSGRSHRRGHQRHSVARLGMGDGGSRFVRLFHHGESEASGGDGYDYPVIIHVLFCRDCHHILPIA